MHTIDLLALASLRASRMGISGIVAIALFFILMHMLMSKLMKGSFDTELYISSGFCLIAYIIVVIAAILAVTIPSIIIAYLISIFFIYMISSWILDPGRKESIIIAVCAPLIAFLCSYAGQQTEHFILTNALK